MNIFLMQDSQVLLQTQHIFGSRRWHRLPPEQWHSLNLPDHLADQVLRIRVAHSPITALLEIQVAEQFPKDAFDYLARSGPKLGFTRAVINVLHCRSPNAHLIFWDEKEPFFHLDLDFANLSAFDEFVLVQIRHLTCDGWAELIQLLCGQSLGKSFFKMLRTHLEKIPTNGENAYHCLVDLVLKLLFLVFVQRKGWLNFDPYYMHTKMEACHARGLSILQCFFRPLFARLEGVRVREWIPLGALPRLGGGLFHFQPEFLPSIPNDWLLNLYRSLVSQYSFSLFETREDREVVGISPEVLGHVFENLLHHPDRKQLGTYFTPMKLALRQVKLGLDTYLESQDVVSGQPGYQQCLQGLKILDPSCGSGTYLVAAFQVLLRRQLEIAPNSERYNGKLYALKRKIVTQNLFGVDIHPLAIRLTEVRLWLNMIQDLEVSEPGKAPPLPSLQHHLRAGDFLGQYRPCRFEKIREWPKYEQLLMLRQKFPYASAGKRVALLRHMARLEDEAFDFLVTKAELAAWQKTRTKMAQSVLPGHPKQEKKVLDLPARQPFKPARLHMMFCQTLLDGGFDLVVGNPPWVSAAKMVKGHRKRILERLKIPAELKLSGQVDLSIYFLVAALDLLKPKGHLGFLMPGKLLQARYARGLRHFLCHHYRLDYLFDFGVDQGLIFHADTFPLALGISKQLSSHEHQIKVEVMSRNRHDRFQRYQKALTNPWGTWVLERQIVDPTMATRMAWPSMDDCRFQIKRGVVTNAKRYFVFAEPPDFIPQCRLKQLLRGRDIQEDKVEPGAWIYWPFEMGQLCWQSLSASEQRMLRRNTKVRDLGRHFRLPYASPKQSRWLVIWRYLAKTWQVALIQAGDWVPDQTTYFLGFDQFEAAYRFFAYCYMPGVAPWLSQHAERGKDRYFFYYAHTVAALPVPPQLNELPLSIPAPQSKFTPQDGRSLWLGAEGTAMLRRWEAILFSKDLDVNQVGKSPFLLQGIT